MVWTRHQKDSGMAAKKDSAPFVVADGFLAAFATNNRINIFLIRNLPDAAWRVKGPGGKGRDAASMMAHIHNVRLMWLKSAGKTPALPAKLEGEAFTKDDAIRALEASWRALEAVLQDALLSDGRIKGFKPDVASFLAYLLPHLPRQHRDLPPMVSVVGQKISQKTRDVGLESFDPAIRKECDVWDVGVGDAVG